MSKGIRLIYCILTELGEGGGTSELFMVDPWWVRSYNLHEMLFTTEWRKRYARLGSFYVLIERWLTSKWGRLYPLCKGRSTDPLFILCAEAFELRLNGAVTYLDLRVIIGTSASYDRYIAVWFYFYPWFSAELHWIRKGRPSEWGHDYGYFKMVYTFYVSCICTGCIKKIEHCFWSSLNICSLTKMWSCMGGWLLLDESGLTS